MPTKTDELRRLALQIAIQLPEGVADAELTLDLTRELLEKFMVADRRSAVHRRAERLGWGGLVPAIGQMPPPATQSLRVGWLAGWLCSLIALAVAAALGSAVVWLFGAGAIATFVVGTAAVSMLYGTRPGILFAISGAVLHNFVLVSPTWALNVPTKFEFVYLGCMLVSAILLPWVADRRERLRAGSIELVRRPALVRRIEAWAERRAA